MTSANRRRISVGIGVIVSLGFGVALVVLFVGFSRRDRDVLFSKPESIRVDGVDRTFRVAGPRHPRRLVVALHGYSGNGRQFAYYTALHNAFGNDTAVVYPDALAAGGSGEKRGWNASFCCGSGWKSGADDVKFLRVLITSLVERYAISPNRAAVVGFSNGAFMAQRLGIDAADLVSAVVAVSGTIGTTNRSLEPDRPVPILLTHGVKDQRVRYEGGASPGDPAFVWQSFAETVAAWRIANGCGDSKPAVDETTREVRSRYGECAVPLETIEYRNNGHKWDGWRLANVWTRTPRASREAAAFIARVTSASA